jgi:hypothetical protein
MSFQVPRQQARYADTGRREIDLLGRRVLASLVRLREADARALNASHEIFVDKIPGLGNTQLVGQTIEFDGRKFRVSRVTDPKASDPVMRGRYLRAICTEASSD